MAKVLVTGATGLIGSSVCRLLADDGDEPVGLVRPGICRESLQTNGIADVKGPPGRRLVMSEKPR
jgi:nucleoside-diphosphate-sugar epimerase